MGNENNIPTENRNQSPKDKLLFKMNISKPWINPKNIMNFVAQAEENILLSNLNKSTTLSFYNMSVLPNNIMNEKLIENHIKYIQITDDFIDFKVKGDMNFPYNGDENKYIKILNNIFRNTRNISNNNKIIPNNNNIIPNNNNIRIISNDNRIFTNNNRIYSQNNSIVSNYNRIIPKDNEIISKNNNIFSNNNNNIIPNNRIKSQNNSIFYNNNIIIPNNNRIIQNQNNSNKNNNPRRDSPVDSQRKEKEKENLNVYNYSTTIGGNNSPLNSNTNNNTNKNNNNQNLNKPIKQVKAFKIGKKEDFILPSYNNNNNNNNNQLNNQEKKIFNESPIKFSRPESHNSVQTLASSDAINNFEASSGNSSLPYDNVSKINYNNNYIIEDKKNNIIYNNGRISPRQNIDSKKEYSPRDNKISLSPKDKSPKNKAKLVIKIEDNNDKYIKNQNGSDNYIKNNQNQKKKN